MKCLYISSYCKTLIRRIIYALFSQPVVSFWGFAPDSHQIHPGTPLGTFVPRPLICPPLEKILQAPMPTVVDRLLASRAVIDLIKVQVWEITDSSYA